MKKRCFILVFTALVMLNCQQPTGKENRNGTKTTYSRQAANTANTSGQKTEIQFNSSLYNAALADEIIDIPDAIFLNTLIGYGVDKNGDGLISKAEALSVLVLSIHNVSELVSMEGLQEFKNITTLNLFGLADLKELPLELPNLNDLWLKDLPLSHIELAHLPCLAILGLHAMPGLNNLNFYPLIRTLKSIKLSELSMVTHLDFNAFIQLDIIEVSAMNNLIALETPSHYDSINNFNMIDLYDNSIIENIDIHLLPNNIDVVRMMRNQNLKKVYINIYQFELFMNNRWTIDRPEVLEVIF